MSDDILSFGRRIAKRRKELGFSLKDVSDRVKKEDGESISPQYLNDIEHDRRQPDSERLIDQLALALKLPAEVLYYEAGKLGDSTKARKASEKQIVAAYKAFRHTLKDPGK
jgi:transcriptional regulator with XRE-family HTH domain